jgi:hypothetical protein
MLRAWFHTRNKLTILSANERGFSAVEALLAAAVFGVLVTGLIGAIVYGRASTASAGDRAAAVSLADEGVQAVRNVRDAAYTNLSDGTYGLIQSSNQWTLSGSSDTNGIYTRQVTIAANGTNRKAITSTVSWAQAGGTTGSVSVTSLLTNWLASIKSWTGGILAGSANRSTTANAIKVDTAGSYAYTVFSATSSNFTVTNIATATAPTVSATISITGTPTNIAVSGNYAYVTTNNASGELVVVNISNPAAPTVAATYNATGSASGLGIYVSGNYAYMTRANNLAVAEFIVLNISTPTAPVVVGTYGNAVAMNEVYVSGGYAYVSISSLTTPLMVINVTNPAAPKQTTTFGLSLLANATTIVGYGNTVYVGLGTSMFAVNVTNPAAPVVLGSFTAAGTVNDIDVDSNGQNAFLGTSSTTGEFQVVDISNSASMSLVRTVDVPGTASTIGGVAYNATYDDVVGASAADTQHVIVFTKG